ncbi:MAG: protein phosphatase 2C domain-containing protein [Herminiimonas sp.]|nr:protein phosphatase 2C domain-containing protein [Herminiimonas sp.]
MSVEQATLPALVLSVAQNCELGDRATNQDYSSSASQDDLACFVVCDGVGGQQGGEVAAHVVVDAILARFCQESVFSERALRSYLDFAVTQVALRKQGETHLKEMSATVATVLIDCQNRRAQFAHMGDTRVYLFREGKVITVTRDHSLVQQFIDAGYWAPEQLRLHALRSTLFAAVGIDSEAPIEPLDAPVALQDGDAILICTDGFWEWIDEAAMERAFAGAATVRDWLDIMRTVAATGHRLSGKERDNSTAVAIWFGTPDQHGQPQSPS